MSTTVAYNDVRWQCACGRFIADSAITCVDRIDPGSYYGVTADCSYQCSRCGERPDLPRIVTVAERQMVVDDHDS